MPSAPERIPRETGLWRSAQQDTYPAPRHGWTCFHCGVTFHATAAAREHFGPRPTSTAAVVRVGRWREARSAVRCVGTASGQVPGRSWQGLGYISAI